MPGADAQHPRRAEHSIGARKFQDFVFEIRSNDADVAHYLETLFETFETIGPLEDGSGDVHSMVVLTNTDDEKDLLLVDGEVTSTESKPGRVTGTVVHSLTRKLIEETDALAIHAGGVVRDGVAVALPAAMESGKSTLTAGLVRAGFSYLTDEAVLFDWATQIVIPFPKPISLDPGSWPLFPELEPEAPLPDGFKDEQWHIPPDTIRPGSVAEPCRIRYIVFPKYAEGATTALTPLKRAEATVELAKNTFRFNERPRRSLDALSNVVPDAECYRLDVGDLSDAVALVGDLADRRP